MISIYLNLILKNSTNLNQIKMAAKTKISELNYVTTKFENLGFFIEYLIGGNLIGCRNVPENERGCVGYESTQHEFAHETILLDRNKKIKKGSNYYTRIYPLCGRVIKK
jgi:hypothetical protein